VAATSGKELIGGYAELKGSCDSVELKALTGGDG